MSFQGKYQVLSALSEGEVRLFRAVQISSGRPVLVHHLAAGHTPAPKPDLASLIFLFLQTASTEQARHLLDMGEDDGRIFVVTADVPECLDLRKWLQLTPEAPAEKGGEPQPAEEAPRPEEPDTTTAFDSETLRVLHSPPSEPVPPSAEPLAAPPDIPNPENGLGDLEPPAEITAASFEAPESGPATFVEFWETASLSDLAGHPTPIPTPTHSGISPEVPSEVPEVSPEFSSGPSSLSVDDAPGAAMTDLLAPAIEPEEASADLPGAEEAEDISGQSVDLVRTPPEMMEVPVMPSEVEVPNPLPPLDVTPTESRHETEVPRGFKELLVEHDKDLLQAAPPVSTPGADDKQEPELEPAVEVPQPEIPEGFDVVFETSKPHLDSAWLDLPDQSGSMAAPAPIEPPTAWEEPALAPAVTDLPDTVPPAVSPPPEMVEDSPALSSPNAPGDHIQSAEVTSQFSVRPSPQAQSAHEELPPEAWSVPAPPVPPARPVPPAPMGDSASTAESAPPISSPPPTPADQVRPRDHVRMLENMRAVAGPRPPVRPPAVPPAGDRAAAKPAAPVEAPARASSPRVPAPQPPPRPQAPPQPPPALYVAHDTPSHTAGSKRKGWVPILILSSLFLMTVMLLLFFAFKR